MATSMIADKNCQPEYSDSEEDNLFPFADKPDAGAVAAAKAAEADEAVKDAEQEPFRPYPLVTSALISFAKATLDKATLDPHTTDSTTLATRIVEKVMKAGEMEPREKQQ